VLGLGMQILEIPAQRKFGIKYTDSLNVKAMKLGFIIQILEAPAQRKFVTCMQIPEMHNAAQVCFSRVPREPYANMPRQLNAHKPPL